VLLSQIQINDYVLVSSSRVGRTVSEYTLRAIATNNVSTQYTNVTATLVSAPANVTIVDNIVVFGTVPGNTDTTSVDEFVIRVDLQVKTSLNDLVWQVNGTVPGSGGGGGGGSPEQAGIFMSIDGNDVIKGDATSKSHESWIVLNSFSEGSNIIFGDGTGGTRPTAQLGFDGVMVSKDLDSSSPLLRDALADGDYFAEVEIDIVKTCDTSLYTAYAITLTLSALSSLEMSSSSSGGVPSENLVFEYTRIETMYTPVDRDCVLGTPIYSFQDATGAAP
jgi:type VI secretion system Hcp family effector